MANGNLLKTAVSKPALSKEPQAYQSVNKIRMITAASLFDGHDSTINIMRRILQCSGGGSKSHYPGGLHSG